MVRKLLPGINLQLHHIQWIVYVSVILYLGRDIFIPLSFATLVAFVAYPICSWLEKRGFGRLTPILLVITLLMIILLAIFALLVFQLTGFLKEWPVMQDKLVTTFNQSSEYLATNFGISLQQQHEWLAQFKS